MRNVLIPAMATFIATSSFAFADSEEKTTGKVRSFDAKALTLALEEGPFFHLSTAFRDPGIKPGEKVVVSWHPGMGSAIAERVDIIG